MIMKKFELPSHAPLLGRKAWTVFLLALTFVQASNLAQINVRHLLKKDRLHAFGVLIEVNSYCYCSESH